MNALKNLNRTHRTLTLAALLLSAAGFSGCGPAGTERDPSTKTFHDTYNTYGTTNGNCHSVTNPNIVPIYDSTNDGSRHYATCFDSATPSLVKVIGKSTRSDWVCAFPVNATGISTFTAIRDVNNLPVSQCWNAAVSGSAGQDLNYYFGGFNGLVVVDYHQRADMNRCLMNNQTCPTDFAIGNL